MNVREFLDANAGKWFSQRTQYDATAREQQNLRGELAVEILAATHEAVCELCQQAAIDSAGVWAGARTQWAADAGFGSQKQQSNGGTAIALFVAGETQTAGELLQTRSDAPELLVRGCYEFRPQGVNPATLVLSAQTGDLYREERLWLAGENLRLRAVRVTSGDRECLAFYSEIRRLPPKTDAG